MKQHFLGILGILLLTSFFSTQANAIPIVWGTNEKVAKIYDFPQNDNYRVSGKHMDLGYKYKAFEIFWIPLHAYEGKVVGYIDDRTYVGLSSSEVSMLAKENNITNLEAISKIPFWDAWGGKLILIVLVIGFIFMSIKGKKNQSDTTEPAVIPTDNDINTPNKNH